MTNKQALIGVIGLALLAGCGGQAAVPQRAAPEPQAATPPRAAARPDMDRDGVPDDVELMVGTDPHDPDTDHDGLTDHYELWGVQGYAVGAIGSLAHLPDANGNGVIAALDPGDAGGQILKNASAVLAQERVPATPVDASVFDPADMDGDGIPNSFELSGFYVEYDSAQHPWLVKWDGKDYTKKYFKTDPTKWSTDGDPFSDFEESTKINLDQRVKIPGDNPCIAAYPDLHMILSKYTITLNQDVEIESSTGKSTEHSWTNSVESSWSQKTEHNHEMGYGGYFDGGFGGFEDWDLAAGFQMKWNVTDSTETETSSTVKNETSGLTSDEWKTAQKIGGNSLEAAFLNLNFDMVNTGTLPASNITAVANILLGNSIIANTLIGNGENGELPGRSGDVITLQASTTGRATPDHPTGENLMLTMNELRSLQAGAPLSVEVVSWKGDTLVWQIDPNTGRRLFLSMGDWSPYQSAIQNTSARLVLDFADDPTYDPQLFRGLPIKRMEDLRVACFPNNGTYFGSPPPVTLLDAFNWAFEAKPTAAGPTITIRDGITSWKHSSYIAGWTFGFDRDTADEIFADPQRFANLLSIPLEPGNPIDHTYTCTAPPSGVLVAPQIYWALCDPLTRKVRSYSRDVRGVKEMRFKPDPNADYSGELMTVGYDPTDPEMAFFYTYELPAGYKWTGNEHVEAINEDDKATELQVQIAGNQLGVLTGDDLFGLPAGSLPGAYTTSLNFINGISVNPPADLQFKEERVGNDLRLTLTPDQGRLYDALFVVDPVDAQGHPILDSNGKPQHVIDYNFLRKQDYQPTPLTETVLATATNTPPPVHAFCVLSSNGRVTVMQPKLALDYIVGGVAYVWKVESIAWRSYDGI